MEPLGSWGAPSSKSLPCSVLFHLRVLHSTVESDPCQDYRQGWPGLPWECRGQPFSHGFPLAKGMVGGDTGVLQPERASGHLWWGLGNLSPFFHGTGTLEREGLRAGVPNGLFQGMAGAKPLDLRMPGLLCPFTSALPPPQAEAPIPTKPRISAG